MKMSKTRKNLRKQMNIVPDRGPTFVGFRPVTFSDKRKTLQDKFYRKQMKGE